MIFLSWILPTRFPSTIWLLASNRKIHRVDQRDTIYPHVRKHCAPKYQLLAIGFSRGRRDSVIRSFPALLFSSQLSYRGSLISTNPGRKAHNERHRAQIRGWIGETHPRASSERDDIVTSPSKFRGINIENEMLHEKCEGNERERRSERKTERSTGFPLDEAICNASSTSASDVGFRGKYQRLCVTPGVSESRVQIPRGNEKYIAPSFSALVGA